MPANVFSRVLVNSDQKQLTLCFCIFTKHKKKLASNILVCVSNIQFWNPLTY